MRLRVWFLLVLLLAPWALATSYPVTVTDDLGRSVTLERAPQRIVSMIPSSTETVCALGACDRLVGVDQFSNAPARVQALPHLGSAFEPDLEQLVALRPDLVLVDQFSAIAGKLEALGIPTYAGTPQSLEELYDAFATLGRLLDEETPAAVLTGRVRGAIDTVARLTADLPHPSVYVEIDATPYSAGPGSFLGELLARAGGANIVPGRLGDYPKLDPEFVLAQDPDVILLADAPYGESLATLRARPGWDGLTAVRNGRVVELTQEQIDELNRPGPRVADAVTWLARTLHPGAFGE